MLSTSHAAEFREEVATHSYYASWQTADDVLLKRKRRFTHLQNFKMLLTICEKKLAIFASIGNYFRPCIQGRIPRTSI